MHRHKIRYTLAAAAAAAFTFVAQAGARDGQVPFSASVSGTASFTSQTTTEFIGVGQATHMGRISSVGEVSFTPPNAAGCYPNINIETLTAANGDQLVVRSDDQACPIGPTSFHGFGNWVVVGGTGRFADATGKGSFDGESDFGPGFSPGPFHFTLTGTVSY
ncbi:MAG TPA: hypothetical protein VLJ76_07280 [Gaiellaceae bacterium]|nr:hypothetical protein [Gaiellaceae bacterium]